MNKPKNVLQGAGKGLKSIWVGALSGVKGVM